jgi:hypothetical protein
MSDDCTCDAEKWQRLAMGWKDRCYEAGDIIRAAALLHVARPCPHGEGQHPVLASNGEAACLGPRCRTCKEVYPCETSTLLKGGEHEPH